MTRLVLVELVSQHRVRYVVEAADESPASYAEEDVLYAATGGSVDLVEFSQKHLGDQIVSSRVISVDEYLSLFDEDNSYLKEWSTPQKLQLINRQTDSQFELDLTA